MNLDLDQKFLLVEITMMNNWPTKKLGEVAEFQKGKFMPNSAVKEGETTPYILIDDLRSNSYSHFTSSNQGTACMPSDTLLVWDGANAGTTGGGLTGFVGSTITKVSPAEEVDPEFLRIFLSSKSSEFNKQVHGAAIPHLNKNFVYNLPISIPPMNVQKQIVGQMDKIAEAQKLNDELIQKANELFYSVMEKEIKPESRSMKQLSFFANRITYGFTNPMPTSQNGPYMITAKDINNSEIKYESCRRTTELAYQELLSDKSRPDLEDILLTKDGTLGRVAIVTETPLCINQSVALIKPNKAKINPKFLKFLLETPECQRKMLANAGGATIKHIYITRVGKMEISVPNLKEQQQIVAKLSAAQEYKKQLLEQKLKLKELFDSVLHKSMNSQG